MLQTELLQETYKTTKNKIAIQIENSKSKRVSLVLVQRTFSLLLFATITIHFIYNFSSFFLAIVASFFQRATFSTHFFPHAVTTFEVVSNPTKNKKKMNTNCRRAKCFACIQHAAHSYFECKSVHKTTTPLAQHATQAKTKQTHVQVD